MSDEQNLSLIGELRPILCALDLRLHALHICHQGSTTLDMVKNQCQEGHVPFK
jgi:hypothetical protein